MSFTEQSHECSRLYAETSALVGQLGNVKTNDELERVNLETVKKLNALREATATLKQLREDENGEHIETHDIMEESVNELRNNIRKRVAEVESRLSQQGRRALGLDSGSPTNQEPVSGAEAANRLGKVNTRLGQIIDRSQATNERLNDSSQVLRAAQGEQGSGSDYLKNANRILDKLKRRKQTDNIIFMACLSFFVATCAYILLKRFTPMFIINRVLYFVPTGWFDAIFTSDLPSAEDQVHNEL